MAAETITHIVLFKYRSDITWSDLEDHFKYFMSLKTRSLHPQTGTPLIKSLRAGKNTSWEPFSKGMTHAFILEFASQDDLDYYLTAEPVHLQFSRDAKPLIEDSVVVDIKDGVLFGAKAEHPLLKAKEGVWRGSCHCEAVRWTARLESAEHVLCHCETCRKLGGGPYSCNQIIPKEELKIVLGNENIGEYKYKGASGKFVHCFYCLTCTSHIYHHQDVMPEKVIVRTLLLEGGSKMPATGEIFAEGKLNWVKELRDNLVNGN
ncbi:hypothetical protein N0V90_010033 [Kalmusia sp. IMI 367209]|nr:hypothetical protein N0V90_010033 [Kalmusia sp. IMI 367209]